MVSLHTLQDGGIIQRNQVAQPLAVMVLSLRQTESMQSSESRKEAISTFSGHNKGDKIFIVLQRLNSKYTS